MAGIIALGKGGPKIQDIPPSIGEWKLINIPFDGRPGTPIEIPKRPCSDNFSGSIPKVMLKTEDDLS